MNMNREQFVQELKNRNISFDRVRFSQKSRYQANRYKPEYVGWEAWIYGHGFNAGIHGTCVTQEDWDNEENRDFLLNVYLKG